MAPACAPSKVAFRQALIGVEKQQHGLSCRETTCHALSVSCHTTHEKLLHNSDTQSVHDTDRVQSTTTHLGRAPGKMSAWACASRVGYFSPVLYEAALTKKMQYINSVFKRKYQVIIISLFGLSSPFICIHPWYFRFFTIRLLLCQSSIFGFIQFKVRDVRPACISFWNLDRKDIKMCIRDSAEAGYWKMHLCRSR